MLFRGKTKSNNLGERVNYYGKLPSEHLQYFILYPPKNYILRCLSLGHMAHPGVKDLIFNTEYFQPCWRLWKCENRQQREGWYHIQWQDGGFGWQKLNCWSRFRCKFNFKLQISNLIFCYSILYYQIGKRCWPTTPKGQETLHISPHASHYRHDFDSIIGTIAINHYFSLILYLKFSFFLKILKIYRLQQTFRVPNVSWDVHQQN